MPVADHAVSAEDLVLGYGNEIALASSSFTIPRGSVTTVIGPNGSGKSTLLNAIAGLLKPLGGVLDVPAIRNGDHRVSYVLQTTKVNDVLPITVYEIVAMARYAGLGFHKRLGSADRDAIDDAMRRTGIEGIRDRHLLDLSGGQRQRVFVAQGLAQDHDVLMLDEPLSGIDLPTAQAIDKVLHAERSRGCTVIMTTHDLSEAQVADHVLLLSGRVIASGEPGAVLTAEHLTAAYGPSLLHAGEGGIYLDDPAHVPVAGRHVHMQRVIHTDALPSDVHHDDV